MLDTKFVFWSDNFLRPQGFYIASQTEFENCFKTYEKIKMLSIIFVTENIKAYQNYSFFYSFFFFPPLLGFSCVCVSLT